MSDQPDKKVRFIDSQYNELFTVPDGSNIVISYEDGEKFIRPCKYIDDYHTQIGHNIYHICEFAERMERVKATYAPEQPLNLPDLCYSTLPSSGALILIKHGERSYSQCSFASGDPVRDKEVAERLNREAGITKQQEAAMVGGSMFGWHTPAARTTSYDFYGSPVLLKPVKSHKKSMPER
ncbi:MAG: hypothetical protein ACYC5K_08295 [Saccharofermentanales bacterium]